MATVSVRPMTLRDVASLRNVRDVQVSLSHGCAPFRRLGAEILSGLPLGRRQRRIFLAASDGEVCALSEARPEPRDFRWVVTFLAAAEAAPESPCHDWVEHWTALLLATVRAAGASGAKRLHACSPAEGPVFEAMRRAGFTAYAYQVPLAAQGLRPEGTSDLYVREQEPSDAWSVHQLYHLVTPHPVQYAEAFTSNHWDVGRRVDGRIRGFLAERGHDVVAYCRITSRGNQHAVDLLALPGEAGLLRELVPTALARLGVGSKDEIWIGVPEYHSEYVSHLEALGFEAGDRQARMVRYTAVPVKAPATAPLGLVPEMGERLSARLPSYSSAKRPAKDFLPDPSLPSRRAGHRSPGPFLL